MTATRHRGTTRGTLLRERDFRLMAGAVGLSAFGDWVAIVALGLHVTSTSNSGYAVAALWVCLFGPSVAVAGHSGLLVDRVETRRLLTGVSLLGAIVAAALGFTTGMAAVLVLTTALGLVFAVLQPAEFALVPVLAGSRIQEANGHIETARYVGYGLGPLVGGVLFSVGGLELAMLVDAATFIVVGGASLALRVRRRPSALDESGIAPRARDGVAFLFRDRLLSLVMVVAWGSLLFMSAVWVGELFFVEHVLGRGEVAYGVFLSVWTAGMAVGALFVSPRVAASGVAVAGLSAVVIQGVGLAVPAFWLAFGFFLACSFAGGLAHGVKNVMFRSLIHARVPERLHGRVFAAYNGIRNSAELGAFAAGGLLVAVVGARGTLAYAGCLSAAAGLAGLLLLLRLTRGARLPGSAAGTVSPARGCDELEGAASGYAPRTPARTWRLWTTSPARAHANE